MAAQKNRLWVAPASSRCEVMSHRLEAGATQKTMCNPNENRSGSTAADIGNLLHQRSQSAQPT